jgi:IS1 family transposase
MDVNKLPVEKRVQILSMLVEGSSMRSISRVTNVSVNTVNKLLIDAGTVCAEYHDKTVRNLPCKKVQCDEIWSFIYAKQKNVERAKAAPEGSGDVWTWTAIDADTKLIAGWMVGPRDAEAAREFMTDVAGRLSNRVQLTTDSHQAYLSAVEGAFGGGVDYAQLVKIYGSEATRSPERRYSPLNFCGTKIKTVTGNPEREHISTSFVERQNLTMRMSMRRFTRLTNAFSKKLQNHYFAISLYFVFYNFVKMHKTLRMTPAMAANLTDKLWSMEDVVALIDAEAPKPGPRGPYKSRISK